MLSDSLSRKSKSLPITESLFGNADESALVETTTHANNASSGAALWMLLMLRLTTVTADERLELRNSMSLCLWFSFSLHSN